MHAKRYKSQAPILMSPSSTKANHQAFSHTSNKHSITMKFSTVATIVVLSFAGFSGAMPARGENAPAVRAENAREIRPTPATASPTTPETNAQRLARGLPPLKPRSMGATRESLSLYRKM